jgi:hypothetical protein
MQAGRVLRFVAIVAAVVVGAGMAALVPGAPAGADVALIDVECDLPSASGVLGGQIPDKQTIEDLEVELADTPDPVVQGQPLSYLVDLPVPNLTDSLDLPPEGAPYGTLEINHVVLTMPIPAGFTVPTTGGGALAAGAVTFSPSVPWLTATKSGSNLLFRVESTVAGSSPTSKSPMRMDLDAASPVIEIQQTAGQWVAVTPLPQVTINGTATGAAGTSIDVKPPSLTLQVQYTKQVLGGILLDVQWNDSNVPCAPLDATQTITSTQIVEPPAPAMTVTKELTAGSDAVAVGEQIGYTVTLANTGNVPLTGVTLSDPNATCEAVATTLAVSASDEVSCTHTAVVGDEGTYSNTATGDSAETNPVASNTVNTTVTAPAEGCTPQFADVSESHPFFNEICWMVDEGVTTGFPTVPPTFKPGGSVTRQAMAAFLQRLSGEDVPGDCIQQFSDVATSHPFFDEICWMVDAEITSGYSDGTFRPGANVSRAAMAAFLYRYEGEPTFTPPGTPTFPDVGSSHAFFDEIEWMVDAGITGGYQDGTFRPAASVTRQSMAAFLYRLSNPE